MKELNRNVLLILDSASSYTTSALILTNTKVLKLPLYTTSKIQPIDASIIASFKLHYLHMQLQHAIDHDEARESDIYQIDQLQAMKWIKVAWGEIFLYVKIISPRDEDGMPIDPLPLYEDKMSVVLPPFVKDVEDLLVEDVKENLFVDLDNELAIKELQQVLDILHLQNSISIKDLLNLEKEKIDTHQQFSDEDFIQTAIEVEQVENEIIIQPLTGKEQLDILRNALRIVDERIDDSGVIMKSLCKLQSYICGEVRKEEAEKQ
ncbi:23218_t:CDS:2, partial [Racocetra persica]